VKRDEPGNRVGWVLSFYVSVIEANGKHRSHHSYKQRLPHLTIQNPTVSDGRRSGSGDGSGRYGNRGLQVFFPFSLGKQKRGGAARRKKMCLFFRILNSN